jgi:hypothetical protein
MLFVVGIIQVELFVTAACNEDVKISLFADSDEIPVFVLIGNVIVAPTI